MFKLNYIELAQNKICAELISENTVINNVSDFLDVIGDVSYNGSNIIIIYEHQLCKEFFDLKTKIAGDIFQKIVNYSFKIAIIGEFAKFGSKSLNDLIYESNKVGTINFVNSKEEALAKLL